MTVDVQPGTPGAPPPNKQQNVFERIAGVLFAPADTFQEIVRRPDFLGPLLLMVIIGYVGTVVMMPRVDFTAMNAAQAEQMRKRTPDMSDEQLAQIEKITAASFKVMGYLGPILFIGVYAILAGVLLLAFRLFGGQGTFLQAFSVTLYAWMPMVIFGIVSTIVILAQGTFDPVTAATLVKSNPAFLVDMKEQPMLYSLLSSLDVFTIWTIALLIVGFATMAKTSKAKAAAIVLSLWAAFIVVKLGFAALGASQMK